MGPHDNPKHEKTVIGAVLEHLKFTVFPLKLTYAGGYGGRVVVRLSQQQAPLALWACDGAGLRVGLEA